MRLKKALSYLFEIRLETTKSSFNPYLEVSISQGRIKLNTRLATYSFEDHYTAFVKAFERLQLKKDVPYRVLVLGYGLGSIPIILKKKFPINAYSQALK